MDPPKLHPPLEVMMSLLPIKSSPQYILENVEHCGGERERVRMWQRMAFAKRSMKSHVTEMEAEKTAIVLVATSTIH